MLLVLAPSVLSLISNREKPFVLPKSTGKRNHLWLSHLAESLFPVSAHFPSLQALTISCIFYIGFFYLLGN